MTAMLLRVDPAVVFLLVAAWGWAAHRAGALPRAVTPAALRRAAGVLAGLICAGLVLAGLLIATIATLGRSGWWLVQTQAVLALPLLVIPAIAATALAVPRLVGLRRAARAFRGALPPALRQEAAHPLVAWPVQLTAVGALAGAIVLAFVSYPATAGSSFAVSAGVDLGGLVTWQVAKARHARLGGAVLFPSRRSRLARSAVVVTAVAVAAVIGPFAALVVAAPPI